MLKALLNFLTGGAVSKDASGPSPSGSARTLRDLQGFVDYVARSLVDYPDDVRVSCEENAEGCTLKIDCRKEDIGKIVGKRGKTIMAIRSLVSGAAGRMRQRVSVEVVD